jgi:hypothetical protein
LLALSPEEWQALLDRASCKSNRICKLNPLLTEPEVHYHRMLIAHLDWDQQGQRQAELDADRVRLRQLHPSLAEQQIEEQVMTPEERCVLEMQLAAANGGYFTYDSKKDHRGHPKHPMRTQGITRAWKYGLRF